MTQKLILFIFLLAFCAQDKLSAQSFCGTDIQKNEKATQANVASLRGTNANFQGKYFVRIVFHILRRKDGTGGRTPADVYTALSKLDDAYNPHNICFSLHSIDYIDSTELYQKYFTYDNFLTNIRIKYVPNAINIYVLPLEGPDNRGKADGVISYLYPGFNYSYVNLSAALGGKIDGNDVFIGSLAHEVGHVLGLLHTHESVATCPEYVNGTNCAACGDLLCDTRAAPNFNIDPLIISPSNCQYIGGATDGNGDPYNPDTHNIMSYTLFNCMTEFSPQQGAVMRGFLATFPDLLPTLVPENLTVQNLTLTPIYVPIPYLPVPQPDLLYKVYGTLTSKDVQSGTNCTLHYIAGDAVIINDGFLSEAGSSFVAEIDENQCNHLTSQNAARGNGDQTVLNDYLSAMAGGTSTSEASMDVFPNPAANSITVRFLGSKNVEGVITIVDAMGRNVYTGSCNMLAKTLDISALANGMYYVTFTGNAGKEAPLHATVLVRK